MTLLQVTAGMSKRLKMPALQIYQILNELIIFDSEYKMKHKDDASPICALLSESISIQEQKLKRGELKQ